MHTRFSRLVTGLVSVVLAGSSLAQNDECTGALTLAPGSTAFNTASATTSAPGWPCAGGGGPDLWYRYSATTNDIVALDTCGSTYDTALQVFSGTCSNLQPIDCNDDDCGFQSTLTWPGVSGTTYYVRIGGYSGSVGSGTLNMTLVTPTANDECTSAVTAGLGSTAFSTLGSSTSFAWPCAAGGNDIWFKYPATSNDTIVVDTCGSAYDTALEAFSGTCGALVSLACNDDACGLQSTINFPGITGTDYYIRVGGYFGNTGIGTLHIQTLAGLTNDECTSAVPLTTGSVGFSTLGSSTSFAWPCAIGGADIWFTFGGTGAQVTIDTCGSGYDTALELFQGTCANLTSLSCNDDSCGLQSQLVLQTTQNATYFLRVGGYNSHTGIGTLNVQGSTGSGGLGTNYCPSVPNTTGMIGGMSAMGSASVASNDVTLNASNLPANQFGIFMTSQTQGFIPFPGGSQGHLCVVGNIGRYNGPGQVLNSGAMGAFSLAIDLSSTPTPTTPTVIQPGETWNFQAWHRDLNPGPVSNFTDAVSILFL